ncbi:MAG TPA: glycosyltransferase family 2 protein [Terriglobia bacterium]|nr:glycosyltransferase family 2 protein [Terriglobia bacterium]
MGAAFIIFLILGILLLAQSAVSLRSGFRFLDYVRRCRAQKVGAYAPRTAVIIPVTGEDASLKQNIAAFMAQEYPQYDLALVVSDEHDPACAILSALIVETARDSGGFCKASLVVAGFSQAQGQKVHNLLRGLDAIAPGAEVLVFADADARPGSMWLRSLVAPLASRDVTVTTGFRWYLPGRSFVSQLRAAWDTSVATLMGEHDSSFPWGGSMAIRAEEFKRLQVRERYWASTVSDDYGLGHAVQAGGGRIRFEPRCLVASRQDSTFAEFIRWTNRQIIITRVYAPRLWAMGLAAHLLYSLAFVCGLLVLLCPAVAGWERIAVGVLLTVILGLGIAKGKIRAVVAGEIFPEEHELLTRYGKCYWQLTLLVPWVMLWNFVIAAFVRTIEWSGVHYRLRSNHEVEITGREPR